MKIVVIGAGFASYNLIKMLRRSNFQNNITVITNCNGNQYYKPNLSKSFSKKINPKDLINLKPEIWAEIDRIDIVFNAKINKIDPDIKLITTDKGIYSYDKLILAYGSNQKEIKGFYNDIDNINSLSSYKNLYKKLNINNEKEPIVIGGGLIGMELASDLSSAGYNPVLICSNDYPLANYLPKEICEYLCFNMGNSGVTFHSGNKVIDILSDNTEYKVVLKNKLILTSNIIINCTGLTVSDDFIKDTKINFEEGVLVNKYLETNIPDIYAIGDCAKINNNRYQYISPIMLSIRALSKTLLGNKTELNIKPFPIIIKIQQSEVKIFKKEEPEHWKVESTLNGKIARGFRQNRMIAFAIVGDALNLEEQLYAELL